ncbi:hypothetical protein CGMCC3_g9891 [Colletotrichum fructicola]|nr:uncharacterized protein CGMCC3_g9891 [Colletotrichum fructicola]KAE9574089.1 hypothetical protein CGMCC3_g9891 [Colletotrichum fructicola]
MSSDSLLLKLKGSFQDCSIIGQNFVPCDILNVVTKEAVKSGLRRSLRSRVFSDGLPGQIAKSSRRLFAILVIIGEPQAIKKLVGDGLNDSDLPFVMPKHASNGSVLKSSSGKTVTSFQDWGNAAKVDLFLEKQWLFLAPVLDVSGKPEVVYVDPTCPLPFLRATEIRGEHSSIVYKSELHAAHQKGAGVQNKDMLIAVKTFHKAVGRTMFKQEMNNLERTQGIIDKHLIRYLFCCERADSYFIAFPWADGGNLEHLWKLHTSDPGLMLWSLQQMLGISGALQKLHEINCRHGDLKPGNILHFKEGGRGRLVIADVGISKVHKLATNMRVGDTNTRATTPAYEPPEALMETDKPRPRRYDIWSMACIYLEFIIWMIYGFDAIASFTDARDDRRSMAIKQTSNFFTLRGADPEIHPSVLNAFAVLRSDPRCRGDTALDDRVTADVMYEKLGKIVQRATKDPSFIMNQVKSRPITPAIFRRPVKVSDGPITATSW